MAGSTASTLKVAPGRFWVGSHRAGLYVYDKLKDSFVRYKDKGSHKYVSSVRGIIQDDHRNIWISTSVGLLKLNKDGDVVSTYGTENSLDPGAFNILAAQKGRNGRLFIGDTTGFYTFLPEKFNKYPPQIELTDFRLLDESVNPGKEGPLAVHVGQAQNIRLRHDQNIFTIEFTGIHFTNPSQNRIFICCKTMILTGGKSKLTTRQPISKYRPEVMYLS